MSAAGTARHLQPRPGIVTGAGDVVEAEFASDRWNAFVLGVPARRGRNIAVFTNIQQLWLRESVKAWCRFRLGAGYSFGTIDGTGQNMARFSTFLAGRPNVVDANGLDRELIEAFLVSMATSRWAASTRSSTLCFLKGFLEWGRRHDTLPGLPADAVIYEQPTSPCATASTPHGPRSNASAPRTQPYATRSPERSASNACVAERCVTDMSTTQTTRSERRHHRRLEITALVGQGRSFGCEILAPSQQVWPGTDEIWRRGRSVYGPPGVCDHSQGRAIYETAAIFDQRHPRRLL